MADRASRNAIFAVLVVAVVDPTGSPSRGGDVAFYVKGISHEPNELA